MAVDLKAIRELNDWRRAHGTTERELLGVTDVAKLLDLVDQQTRALLAAEWASYVCPVCEESPPEGHATKRGCALDAALTAAGLDTQEKREAAREKRR